MNKTQKMLKGYPYPTMSRCFMHKKQFAAIANGFKKVVLSKGKHKHTAGDFMQIIETDDNMNATNFDLIVCIEHVDSWDDDTKLKRLRKNCQALSIVLMKTFKRI